MKLWSVPKILTLTVSETKKAVITVTLTTTVYSDHVLTVKTYNL